MVAKGARTASEDLRAKPRQWKWEMTSGCRATRDPAGFKEMTTSTASESIPFHESIKLGIDAHAKYYSVNRQVDGATP